MSKKLAMTQFAEQAYTVADAFRSAFAKTRLADYAVDCTAPEGSTHGGLLALQHITLKTPQGMALVVGLLNTKEKTAELRSWGYVVRVHGERFKRPPPFDQGAYEHFLNQATPILSTFGVVVRRVDPAPEPTAPAMMQPAPPATSSLPMVPLVLSVVFLVLCLGGAAVAYLLRMRHGIPTP